MTHKRFGVTRVRCVRVIQFCDWRPGYCRWLNQIPLIEGLILGDWVRRNHNHLLVASFLEWIQLSCSRRPHMEVALITIFDEFAYCRRVAWAGIIGGRYQLIVYHLRLYDFRWEDVWKLVLRLSRR